MMEGMKELEVNLQSCVTAHLVSRRLPSRFQFRPGQCCIVGEPVRAPHSREISKADAEFILPGRRGTLPCLVEDKVYKGVSATEAYPQVVGLARNLKSAELSGEGLLELAGFQEVVSPSPQPADHRFRLVFSPPKGRTNPRSLRDILLDEVNETRPPIPRNYGFILPRKLAEAVYQVHRQDLVHKCIRPESILLFDRVSGDRPELRYPEKIGAPYLVDWQHLRGILEASKREVYYDDWTMAIYQHPERQGPPGSVAEYKYNIGHDIYSLGVCFLEIGLWDSFVVENDQGQKGLSRMLTKAKTDWKEKNPTWINMTDSQIEQKAFMLLAGDPLAYEMGEVYSRLVLKCLSCLEKGFGNILRFVNSSSKDWDEQGLLFIQEIRKELESAVKMG